MIEDNTIISLFFSRNEKALYACRDKYGSYIGTILNKILKNKEDTEECLDDVWMAAWNSIPPTVPHSLQFYLAGIARNIGIDKYSMKKAQKRCGQVEELLEEIACFTPTDAPEDSLMEEVLRDEINLFLETQEKESRICFVLRYYYSLTYDEISQKTGKGKHAIASLLCQMRQRLKKHLISRGYNC